VRRGVESCCIDKEGDVRSPPLFRQRRIAVAREAVRGCLGVAAAAGKEEEAVQPSGICSQCHWHTFLQVIPPAGRSAGGRREALLSLQCCETPDYFFGGTGCLIFPHMSLNTNPLNVGLLSLWHVLHFASIAASSLYSCNPAVMDFALSFMTAMFM